MKSVFLFSSYMLLFSLFPEQKTLFLLSWPFLFFYLALKILVPMKFQIPFTLDLLKFGFHFKIFKDSIREVKIFHFFFLFPLLFVSFYALQPSLIIWFPIWFFSLFIRKKDRAFKTSHSFKKKYPFLRISDSFEGEKLFELNRKKKPHIIFLFLESFRAKNVGALGAKTPLSPEFDRLSSEGALFPHFYANGLQTFRALISSLFGIPAHLKTMSLSPFLSIPMIGLPEILKKNGYQTAHFQGNCSSFDWTYPFLKKAHFDIVKGEEHFISSKKMSWGLYDEELFSQSLQFLEKQKDPTFLSLFTITNHHPWISPIPFDVPEHLDEMEKNYLQTFQYTDHCLGHFIRDLKKKGLYQNSLIFILGDHGQELGKKRFIPNSLSLDNIHIPLLILGVTPTVINTLGSQVDLLPTLLDLLEMKALHHSVGKSLRRKTKSKVFISMPRENGLVGEIIEGKNILLETSEAKSYFFFIDEVYKKKKWAPLEHETILDRIDAPPGAKDEWLMKEEKTSSILNLKNSLISEKAFFKIKERQKKLLHELDLTNSPFFTDLTLSWLKKEAPHLSILHLGDCCQMSESGLANIMSHPSLQYLSLENSPLFEIPLKEKSNLTALHLKGCTNFSENGFLKVSSFLPNLIYLTASFQKMESDSIKKLKLKKLHYLWLQDGQNIEKEPLISFLFQNRELQILILENFPNVKELDLKGHPSLQSLKIT